MAINDSGSLVILVIVFLAALAFQAQVEGKPQDNFIRNKEDNVSRIIDHTLGENFEPEKASLGQFPWQVLVISTKPRAESLCGGSIIDQEWIMSAAHCIAQTKFKKTKANGYEIDVTRVRLIVGKIDRDNQDYEPNEPTEYDKAEISNKGKNQRVFIHKDYNTKIDNSNDIVLFKLKKPLTLTNYVKPILLATIDDVNKVKKITAAGWGKMYYDTYKPYQSGKYWTIPQCSLVTNKEVFETSLNTCMTECDSTDDCEVFFYRESISVCGLQNCNGEISEPTGEREGIIGYTSYDQVYKNHQTSKAWSSSQCGKVVESVFGEIFRAPLQTCKNACIVSSSCNGFNYKAEGITRCQLCKLSVPITEPIVSSDGYIGYTFYKGLNSKTLRYVTDLDLKSQDECVTLYPGKISPSGTMLCHQTTKKTVFSGDSGGPVSFTIEGIDPPINVQIGINSWVTGAVNDGAVFTNVAMFKNWIHKTMSHPLKDSILDVCTFMRDGSKRCMPTSCPDDGDFFTLTVAGRKQCFKVVKQSATWEQANNDCMDLNLTLAQPLASVQLRSYIVQEYGSDFYVWLGACQEEPNKMMWKVGGEEITKEDPLWYPGQPNYHKGCLLLLTSETYWQKEPEKPFWNVKSTYEFYPLCELVLA